MTDINFLKEQKQKLLENLSKRFPQAVNLHKKFGLFELDESGRSWENASQHCFLESARVGVLADKLHFSEKLKNNLMLAAAAHDFYKKYEVEAIEKEIENNGSGINASAESIAQSFNLLRENNFDKEVIRILSLVGGYNKTLFKIKNILDKKDLKDEDLSVLVMHYVDDYTSGTEWSESAFETQSGKIINDVDRRMEKNLNNPNYQKMNEEAKKFFERKLFFEGKTTFEAMAEISHLIEIKLTELIKERNQEIIEPLNLPEIIDKEIQHQMSNLS